MVGSVGGGLFKTVTSAATGDLAGAAGGLSDATVGTAGKAVGTVGEASGTLAGGAVAAGESTVGADNNRRWRKDTPRRWEEAWEEARQFLIGMPFPPPPRQETPSTEAGEPAGKTAITGDSE